MFWRLGDNSWWLEVGWCKLRVPPKIAKIRLRIIRVCHINGVLIRMGRLKSPYDPSLFKIIPELISGKSAVLIPVQAMHHERFFKHFLHFVSVRSLHDTVGTVKYEI